MRTAFGFQQRTCQIFLAFPSYQGCEVGLSEEKKFTDCSFDFVIFFLMKASTPDSSLDTLVPMLTGWERRPRRNFLFIKWDCKAAIFSFCTSAHDKLFLFPLIHFLLFFKNISCFLSLVLSKINPCQDSSLLSGGQHHTGWPFPRVNELVN